MTILVAGALTLVGLTSRPVIAEPKLPAPVTGWALVADGIELTIDANATRDLVRQHLPEIHKRAPADVRQGFEWFNFRFSNLRLVVDSVSFNQSAQPKQLGLIIHGGVEADREKKRWVWRGIRSGIRWTPDGGKRVFDLAIHGHLDVSIEKRDCVSFRLIAESVTWKFNLRPFREKSGTASLRSSVLHQEQLVVPGLADIGVTVANARVTKASSNMAEIIIELAQVASTIPNPDDTSTTQNSQDIPPQLEPGHE